MNFKLKLVLEYNDVAEGIAYDIVLFTKDALALSTLV